MDGHRDEPPRFLRRLLALFPPRHRGTYGEEMWDVVVYRWQCRKTGHVAKLRFLTVAAIDMVWNATRVWGSGMAGPIAGLFSVVRLELRLAVRALGRAPGFSLTAVFVLGGAVAVNVSVFSFIRGSLLEEPPYFEPNRVVVAWGSNPVRGQLRDVVSGSNFIDLAAQSRSLVSLAAVHEDEVILLLGTRPVVTEALQVTVGFLHVLGVTPALGRDFGEEDRFSGAAASSMVSHAFWQDQFGGDPGVVGRALIVDGQPTTVVGILRSDFRFISPSPIVVPLRDDALAAESRTHHHYTLVGRLQANETPAGATRELTRIMGDIADEDPRMDGWTVLVEPLHEVSVAGVRSALWLLGAAVTAILAIAVVNLASLLRIRALTRLPELAVRRALGARRSRVAATLMTEAALISAAAGALGLAAASPLLRVMATLAPPTVSIPGSALAVPALRAALDVPLVSGALLVSLTTGLLLAVPSILLVTGDRSFIGGRDGTRVHRGHRLGWLVGTEIALATALCVGSALTLRSARDLAARDPGLNPDHVLTVYFGDVGDRSVEARAEYFRQVIERVERVRGVDRVGLNDYVPFQGEDDFQGIRFADRPAPLPGQGPREEWRRVSEGLFEAAGMRVTLGRGFLPDDFQSTPSVVVLNRTFASKYYPTENPIGKRLTVTERGYADVVVVGVVDDVLGRGPAVTAPAVLYAPYHGAPRGHMAIFARVAGDPADYAAEVRDAIASVDSGEPVLAAMSMQEYLARTMSMPRMTRDIVGALAVIALFLAGTGIFGVVGYAVRSQRSELGVRMALGATVSRLEATIVRQAAPVLLCALAGGIVLAVGVARGASYVLHGVTPADPLSIIAAALIIGVVALLAVWLPAHRVSQIDAFRAINDRP